MGKRDFAHRETKKPKKTAKKPEIASIIPTPVNTEVVDRKKKHREETGE